MLSNVQKTSLQLAQPLATTYIRIALTQTNGTPTAYDTYRRISQFIGPPGVLLASILFTVNTKCQI